MNRSPAPQSLCKLFSFTDSAVRREEHGPTVMGISGLHGCAKKDCKTFESQSLDTTQVITFSKPAQIYLSLTSQRNYSLEWKK